MSDSDDVLVLNGLSQTEAVWRDFPSYTVLNLPGHGAEKDAEIWNASSLSEEVFTSLDRPKHVVAWSLGAVRLLDYISRYGMRNIKRITFLAPISDLSKGGGQYRPFKPGFFDGSDEDNAVATRYFLDGFGAIPQEDLAAIERATLSVPQSVRKKAAAYAFATRDFDEILAQINVPVRVISGIRDDVVDPKMIDWLAAKLGCSVEQVDFGHAVHLTLRGRL